MIHLLFNSPDPSLRYLALTQALGLLPEAPEVQAARQAIPASPRVQALLSHRQADGRLPYHPYSKWLGAHWTLYALAELGYPPGDLDLVPLREQVLDWLLGPAHTRNARSINGRVRACASMESNALLSLLRLGLADGGDCTSERCQELVRRLHQRQWPDGGWNCDKRPQAINSSFMETLLPLRALTLHARLTGDPASQRAAERAAGIFLERRLFRRRRDGAVIEPNFLKLHFPLYWHYDILGGLHGLAEAGYIDHPACQEALDILESKRLPDGGFPAEARYYTQSAKVASGRSLIEWGSVSARKMNPFVTVQALFVLRQAGRFKPDRAVGDSLTQ